MTRDEAKKHMLVIQAFADGKSIQYRPAEDDPWEIIENSSFDCPGEYRIKPDPMERWVVVDRDGDEMLHDDKEEAEDHASSKTFAPYTIYHMREVED